MRQVPATRQRVAAYAVILRDDQILLSRLAAAHRRGALDAARRRPRARRGPARRGGPRGARGDRAARGHRRDRARLLLHTSATSGGEGGGSDAHALRIVYDGWVPLDGPEPHVVEVDGSTMEAAWQPVADVARRLGARSVDLVHRGAAPTTGRSSCSGVAAYALVVRDGRPVLLTRNSARGPHPGSWTLPGGGIDHGEQPRAALVPRGARGDAALDVRGRRAARRRSTRTSRAPPRRAATRTSTRVQLVFDATVAADASRASSRSTAPPTRSPGCRWPTSSDGRVPPVRDVVTASALAALRPLVGWPAVSETVFTYAAPALKFGAGRVGRDRPRPRDVRRPPGAAGHRPGRGGDRPPRADRRADPAARHRGGDRTTGRTSSRPTSRSSEAIDFARGRRARSTRSSRSAAAPSIDTAKAVNLLTTNPGELMDYINAPVGKAQAPEHAAAAAGRGPDHDRHRQREHHDLRARRAVAEGEDRDQPPRAASDAGRRRPAAHR